MIGDIGALLPRNRPELVLGALLSVNAGVVEELLFRLAVPALIFGATGSATGAVIGSVLLFAVLHFYQGWPGMIGALVIGALLMVLYLATGSILVVIVAHALIDLRSLVLIPMLVFGVHRVRV
nr:CPBP family intramembrane glutamic endopeptidase [Frigoribacterium sp. CG_9.8]